MRIYPKGYGGKREDPEAIKRQGWQGMGTLVISADDPRLSWPEQELVKQLGNRLYGKAPKPTGEGGQP